MKRVKILEYHEQLTDSLLAFILVYIKLGLQGGSLCVCPTEGAEILGGLQKRVFGNREHHSELGHDTHSQAKGKS